MGYSVAKGGTPPDDWYEAITDTPRDADRVKQITARSRRQREQQTQWQTN